MGSLLGRAVRPPATDLAGGITDFHGHGLDTGVLGGHLDLMTLGVFSGLVPLAEHGNNVMKEGMSA